MKHLCPHPKCQIVAILSHVMFQIVLYSHKSGAVAIYDERKWVMQKLRVFFMLAARSHVGVWYLIPTMELRICIIVSFLFQQRYYYGPERLFYKSKPRWSNTASVNSFEYQYNIWRQWQSPSPTAGTTRSTLQSHPPNRRRHWRHPGSKITQGKSLSTRFNSTKLIWSFFRTSCLMQHPKISKR